MPVLPVVPVEPVVPVAGVGVAVAPAEGVGVGVALASSDRSAAPFDVRHGQLGRRPGDLGDVVPAAPAAGGGEGEREYGEEKRGAEQAHGGGGARQRGSAAMRRPHVGQSLRSFWAIWSHQLQNRRFSTAHGSCGLRRRERQQLADDLQRLARLAVEVGVPWLGLDEDLAAGGGRAEAVLLAHRAQTSKRFGQSG